MTPKKMIIRRTLLGVLCLYTSYYVSVGLGWG